MPRRAVAGLTWLGPLVHLRLFVLRSPAAPDDRRRDKRIHHQFRRTVANREDASTMRASGSLNKLFGDFDVSDMQLRSAVGAVKLRFHTDEYCMAEPAFP